MNIDKKIPIKKETAQSKISVSSASESISSIHHKNTPVKDNRSKEIKDKFKKISIASVQSMSSISMPSGMSDDSSSTGNKVRSGRFNIGNDSSDKEPPLMPKRSETVREGEKDDK